MQLTLLHSQTKYVCGFVLTSQLLCTFIKTELLMYMTEDSVLEEH